MSMVKSILFDFFLFLFSVILLFIEIILLIMYLKRSIVVSI